MNELQMNRASEITRLHNEIRVQLKASLENALRIGELLTEQKAVLRHGAFTAWIIENLPFTDRTARNYMMLYEHRDRLKTETVSDLNGAYRLLRRPPLPTPVDAKPDDDALPAENTPDWMPGVGEISVGQYRRGENHVTVTLVRDAEESGFVRIYCMEDGGIDEAAILEGFRRGVRVDRVPTMLEYLHVDPNVVEWQGRARAGGGNGYAKCLYDLLEPNWLRRAKARA